jgi:DNA modification methylase
MPQDDDANLLQRLVSPSCFRPYYDKCGITIYNADCRRVLPFLDRFDLLLTDPPYGIGEDGGRFRDRKGGGHRVLEKGNWDGERIADHILLEAMQSASTSIVWGGNYYADLLPASRGWLYWDKKMGGDFSDGELAYTTRDSVLRSFSYCNKEHGKEHPTQKPLALMRWCLSLVPDAATVLDPFMGSGTTLVAAKLEGRKAVGIEISEKYCEIAARRLSQGVLF